MPTNDDIASQVESHDEAPVAATPNVGMSREEIRAEMREMAQGIVEGLMPRNRPAPQEQMPEPEGYSEEELESLTPQQRSLVNKAIKRGIHEVKKEMAQFRDFGLARLGELTESNMRTQLPYYTKYEKEIKSELDRLNPALRTDPTTIRIVHDSVAMRHENERMEETRQQALRTARGDAPAPATSGPMRGAPLPKGVPSPEDLGFNEMQLSEIERVGGPDSFARHVSQGRFQNWEAYAKSYQGFNTAPKIRGRNVIQFPKLSPKKGGNEQTA